MRWFYWVGGGDVPAMADLRDCGWSLREGSLLSDALLAQGGLECVLLVDGGTVDPASWRKLNATDADATRQRTMVLSIADGGARARLLGKGFGDALPASFSLAEVEARAQRILDKAGCLPRWRRLGLLTLDLLGREAFVDGKPLGLHPREFGVLWRMMETPGKAVHKFELLRDVWQVSHVPETNSVAVHTSRLRAKLAAMGLAGWIQTRPGGAYQLAMPDAASTASVEPMPNLNSGAEG